MSTYDQEEEIEGICAVLEVVYWADWEVVIFSYQDIARITEQITKTIVKIIAEVLKSRSLLILSCYLLCYLV